ncbi:Sau3AI family type II restriction endonuclease [Bacillus sp. FJAT-27986]|uniref:Sau3AI family type II restriction endonuclease n=1 Tax=Bacillus sp. FJAT-27986 TaxID=1743146 RepID=UPI00080AF238|nr:Sau3AI family type II restriction endonuclease [Bacillus sp. FJAT-27986]OCA86156.1 restriction endonuclease [Bacillus sp. FJAT-27986]
MIYYTPEEVYEKAEEAIGKTFGEIDKTGRIKKETKGSLGQVIEESLFEYKVNSDARADFEEAGVELKVTAFKRNKNGSISAKERLVLNIINYMEEVKTIFETSSFWKKNQTILLMVYEWLPNIPQKDLRIYKNILHDFSEADLQIIKQDWQTIVNKIRDGKAHELSEGDTNYLGACTKGANKSSLRQQPFSDIPAMQRAFSLKGSYMTALLRKHILNVDLVRFTDTNELKTKTLEELLEDRFSPYYGMKINEISKSLKIPYNSKAKQFNATLISAILGVKGTKLDSIEEFAKANIQFKTVRLEPSGKPRESMSFENINFHQWTTETWEESYIRQKFTETKFLFTVFEYKETEKENPNRELIFKGIKLWNMPHTTIETEIKQLWEEVNRVIKEGIQIEYKKRGTKLAEFNNLPKSDFNGVAHVRPKGRDGNDKITLPTGEKLTKQCYWLNNSYIEKIVNE